MSTHAREYWLNVQAREAIESAMGMSVEQWLDDCIDDEYKE